eukprot:4185936-Amphidinium_carterae.1
MPGRRLKVCGLALHATSLEADASYRCIKINKSRSTLWLDNGMCIYFKQDQMAKGSGWHSDWDYSALQQYLEEQRLGVRMTGVWRSFNAD